MTTLLTAAIILGPMNFAIPSLIGKIVCSATQIACLCGAAYLAYKEKR